MPAALDGLRVLDFSWAMSGAIATMVLSDNGADVVKVEPPQGDPMRSRPAFLVWHRGKKSVTLDLKRPDDLALAKELATKADVLVQDWRPGVAERLGLDYETLAAANPGLIYCHITGFGQRGKYAQMKAYHAIVQAKAGRGSLGWSTHASIFPDRPAFYASPVHAFGASQMALHGILSALHVRGRTGKGQKVETSLIQGMMAFDIWDWIIKYLADEYPDAYQATPQVSTSGAPLSPYFFMLLAPRTKDGRWFQLTNVMPHMWQAFIRAVGLEWIYDDPELKTAPNFTTEAASLRFLEILLGRFQEKTADEWLEIFLKDEDIGVELFRTTQEAMDHPQLSLIGGVIEVDDPRVGKTRQIGPLVKLWETPARVRGPAPALGEHNSVVRTLWRDATPAAPKEQLPERPLPKQPLEDVTVVEFSTFYAAAFGTALLADLGARVIHVEPLEGDPLRWAMPIPETGAAKAMAGKESLAIDLRSEQGRQIIHELVRKADAVMCSFRPGVAERLGIDYATLRQINPNLIYVHGVSYGLEGLYARRPVFGPMGGAVNGEALYQIGGGNLPPREAELTLDELRKSAVLLRKVNPGYQDASAAIVVATGILLGLAARERTGIAQQVMTTFLLSNDYVMSEDFIRYEGKPERPLPDKDLLGLHALYRLYQCKERWVFLACPRADEWFDLCRMVHAATDGKVNLADDPRFSTPATRRANLHALASELEAIFKEKPASEWEDLAFAHDVACVAVSDDDISRTLLRDPLIHENGFVAKVEHPVLGPHLRHGLAVNLSLTPGEPRAGCALGQHTRPILRELGYTDAEINRLHEQQVVRDWQAPAPATVG